MVAFAHFRFEVDDDDAPERAVLYVRELQVAEARRGSGIGRRVMGLLQLVGAKLELDCVLLTVFESNKGALAFYEAKLVDGLDPTTRRSSGRPAHGSSRALPKPAPSGRPRRRNGYGARRGGRAFGAPAAPRGSAASGDNGAPRRGLLAQAWGATTWGDRAAGVGVNASELPGQRACARSLPRGVRTVVVPVTTTAL